MLSYHTSAHPSNPPTIVLRLLPHRQSLAQRPALLTAPTNEVISLLLQRCHPFAGYISPATKSLPGAGHKREVYHPSQSLSNPQITFRQFVATRLVSRFAAAFTASCPPNPKKILLRSTPWRQAQARSLPPFSAPVKSRSHRFTLTSFATTLGSLASTASKK